MITSELVEFKDVMLDNYQNAIAAWNSLILCKAEQLKLALSGAQIESLNVLLYWINASHRTPSTDFYPCCYCRSVVDHDHVPGSLHSDDVALFPVLYDHQVLLKPSMGGSGTTTTNRNANWRASSSEYSHLLSRLFETEFGLQDPFDEVKSTYTNAWTDRLLVVRRTATYETATYRIASNVVDWWLIGAAEGKENDSTHLHLSHTSPINACPWLEATAGLPFFLWDVYNECTIETSTIASPNVQYTAVSHTWGRWEKPSTPPVHVSGVDGWRVPQNFLFDVQKLPSILKQVPTNNDYIWLDLVCIPQDESLKAKEEIARQAVTFQGADRAIVWFNCMPNWSGTRSMLHWSSLKYMTLTIWDESLETAKRLQKPLATAFAEAKQSTGFFEPYNDWPKVSEKLKGTGWFTSLWTLQEACLRPDMLLCDSNWNILEATPGVSVTLQDIIALLNKVTSERPSETVLEHSAGSPGLRQFDMLRDEASPQGRFTALLEEGRYPRAFLEIYELLERSHMRELSFMRPETLTLLGTERFCQKRRAEAIMSVLGVTDWYTQALALGKDPGEQDLVLDSYPLVFLRAAAERFGARFYSSALIRNHSFHDEDFNLTKGSLLPFRPMSSSHAETREIPRWGLWEEDLPSANSTWKIQPDGSVTISSAEILAVSNFAVADSIPKVKARAEIYLAYPEEKSFRMDSVFEGDRLQTMDLQTWADTWRPDTVNYVVGLTESRVPFGQRNRIVRGVLLKSVPGRDSGVLVKVGVFSTSALANVATPRTREVKWTVL